MSGGKRKSRSTQNTQQTLNPWSQNQWQTQFDNVQGMLNSGTYTPYEGEMISGPSGAEQQAYDYVTSTTDPRGSAAPEYEEFNANTYNPLSYENDFNEDVYVNPHRDALINQMQGDVQEAAARNRAQAKSAALANGSFGGGRHGVREALIDESELDTIADQTARIGYDSYNRGLGMFENDAARHERAFGMNEAGRYQEYQSGRDRWLDEQNQADQNEQRWLNNLMTVGSNHRGITDRQNAAAYAEHLRAEQDRWQQIQAQMGLLGSIPMLVNTQSEGTNVTKQNPGVAGMLGTGLTAAGSMFGAGGMFGQGGAFGGLFGGS